MVPLVCCSFHSEYILSIDPFLSMAPKKAPAVPKRTIEEVNEEFAAKQAASAARMEELKKLLLLAKKDCDSARLDLVATRENRVYYSAKVTAMTNANEVFDEACKHDIDVLKQAVKQVKRTGKDKGYEVNYVREVAAGVEREMDLVQTSIAQVETDVRTDPRDLERELDRLAFVVGGLVADRPRLQRTSAALIAAKERMEQVAPRRIVNAAPSPLQLTIIGSSSASSPSTPAVRSAYACGEVLKRVEDVLTARCGFDVVERIVPDVGSWCHRKGSSSSIQRALQRRVVEALRDAASIPKGLESTDVPSLSIVVIHCPSSTRRVAMADGTPGSQHEIVLHISQIPDDAKAFLASTSAGREIFWDDVGTTTIPLNAIIAMTLAHHSNKQVTLLVDTWPADSTDASIAFALFWSSNCMSFPLLYAYRSQFHSTDVQRCHAEATRLSLEQRVPRGCMLEVLVGIVEGSDGAHLIDAVTAGRAVAATLNRRFAHVMDLVETPAGPFATLALRPRELRAIHHCMPLHLRPLPSPHPLHVECRDDVPELEAYWCKSEPLPSQYKWCRRGPQSFVNSSSAAGRHLRAPTGKHALLRSYAEESTGAPHVRFLIDVAIEDPRYHVSYEDVEDLDASKVLSQHLDDVHMSLDISQVAASPAKPHGGDASLTSLGTLNEPASARPGAVTCRRIKKLVDDGTEWCELVGRRLRQALISADEDTRFIKQVHTRGSSAGCALHVLPAGLVEPTGPIPFTVTCKPLDPLTHATLGAVMNPVEWFVEGKRCPERTVNIELSLTLDVKPAEAAPSAPLVQSVRLALERLCCALDANRPEALLLQVAVHVDVQARGGSRDATNFTASVRIAAVLTEQAMRDRIDACTAATHWLRATLTHSLGRWDAKDGHEWIRCVESTTNEVADVFRVIRVFHVQRNWECGLRLMHGGRGAPPLLEAQLEKHVSWSQHLVRLVLAQGGFAGGGLAENTHSPAGSDHRGPDTSVRLLDVKDIPKFIGVQRRALVHGHQALGDDALGPGSSLNGLTESELAVALNIISHQHTRPAVTMAQANAVENRLLASFVPPSAAAQGVGVVLLTWLLPQSFLRVVQRTPPHLDDEATSVSEVHYLVRSLVEQFHMQHRLNTSDPAHPQLYVAATTSFVFDDDQPETNEDDVMALASLLAGLSPEPVSGEVLVAGNAMIAGEPTELNEPQEDDAVQVAPLPAESTAEQPPSLAETEPVTSDVDAELPATDAEPLTAEEVPTVVATEVQALPVAEPAAAPQCSQVEGACLRSQFVHATNPLASLFPLTPRFWEEVQEHTIMVGSSGRRCTLPAKIGLIATTWPRGVDQSGQPVVRRLTLHTATRSTASNTSVTAVAADDRLALRSRVVDAFLQSCVEHQ
jgi:hypothetical protein